MITHQEAEILTSARQDAPLDALVERELQAHLATCDQCRSFAAATERLTAGIRTLPGIAASPRMKRDVMDRVRAGRNPFARLLGGFGGGFQPGPALAAVAMVAVIGIFGWLAVDRLFFDEGSDGNNQIAAVPTTEITFEMASPTDTPQPTATVAPVTVESTQTPVPTATTAPQPTETAAPTEPPAPTATIAPEPTATLAPTATTAPQPTATTEPAVEPTADGGPVDLTRSTNTVSRVEPTTAPTQTAVPPTATTEPTPAPTATSVPPTPTPTPEVVPTATETPLPEPTPTPAIEPMDGATSEPVNTGDSANNLGIGSADDNAEIPTSSTGNRNASETPTTEVGGTDAEITRIEPITPEGQGAGGVTTPEAGTEMTEGAAAGPTQLLADVSEPYGGIVGDLSESLGLTTDGRLEFMQVPDAASVITPAGYRLQMADGQPGVVQVCGDGFCEPGTAVPEADDWLGDVPLGVVDSTVYMLRQYPDRTEVYMVQAQDTQLVEETLIGEFASLGQPAAVYESSGTLYSWMPTGEWLQISGDTAQLLPGSYPNPVNVRFAPSAEGGPVLGYFSDGMLIIAPVSAPDAAIIALPADGIDFDISPPGDRVAVIRGTSIVIYDLQGNELAVYEGGDMQPGSLIWLRGGIVWVDRSTGLLYEIAETAP